MAGGPKFYIFSPHFIYQDFKRIGPTFFLAKITTKGSYDLFFGVHKDFKLNPVVPVNDTLSKISIC